MKKAKYIVLEMGPPFEGMEPTLAPILFPDTLTHAGVAQAFGGAGRIRSAGFVDTHVAREPYGLGATTYGRSDSLNLEPHEDDAVLIARDTLLVGVGE